MAFLRQYIAPFLILLVFLVALVAVSIRSFIPQDMAAPAPIESVNSDQLSFIGDKLITFVDYC